MIALPEHVVAEARRLTASGMKRKDIAKKLNISENSILRYCKDVPKPFEHRGVVRRRVFSRLRQWPDD